MRKEFAKRALHHLSTDSDFYTLLGDISIGLFVDANDRLPNNCLNVGIMEQATISFAAGLSSAGKKVVVHTIGAFLIERTYEQIKLDLIYNKNPVVLVSANGPYEYAKLGPTHHSANDVPLMVTFKSVKIYLPSYPEEIASILDNAISDRTNTSYIRLFRPPTPGEVPLLKPSHVYTSNTAGLNAKKLLIVVGELVHRLASFLEQHSPTDFLYINTLPLVSVEFNNFNTYEKIIVYEPYASGIIASYLRGLCYQAVVFSFTYPKIIEEGIFNEIPLISDDIGSAVRACN